MNIISQSQIKLLNEIKLSIQVGRQLGNKAIIVSKSGTVIKHEIVTKH
jgi:hypothetical protein